MADKTVRFVDLPLPRHSQARTGADSVDVIDKGAFYDFPVSVRSAGAQPLIFPLRDMDGCQLTASNSTVVENVRCTDVSTSTTDSDSYGVASASMVFRQTATRNGPGYDMNDYSFGFVLDSELLQYGASVSPTLTAAVFSTRMLAQTQPPATTRRTKTLSPNDLVEPDGLTKIDNETQQPVREMKTNYETRLCSRGVQQWRNFARTHLQPSLQSCSVEESKKVLNIEDSSNESIEPISYDSRGNASEASLVAVEERDAQPMLWVPDKMSRRCIRCDGTFSSVDRLYHSRSCGELFCSACSNYECAGPHERLDGPVCICNICYSYLQQPRRSQLQVLPRQKVFAST